MAKRKTGTRKKAKSSSSKKTSKSAKRGPKRGNTNASKYDPKYGRVALGVYMLGGGPEEAAEACGVSRRTFYNWLKNKPEIAEAAGEGEKWFDDHAEAVYRKGLILQATPHDEVTEREGPDGLTRITKKDRFTLRSLADYLKRRRPEKYGEKRKHEIGADDDVKGFLDWLADGDESKGGKD